MGLGEAGRIVDGVPIGINRKVSLLRSAFAALKWRCWTPGRLYFGGANTLGQAGVRLRGR
jgi:hypothetical protein